MQIHAQKNPRDNAGFFSKLTFWWLMPLMIRGCKKPLEKEDLSNPQKQDASKLLGDLVSKNWENELRKAKEKGRKPRYAKALIASFWRSYLLYGLLAFMEECIFKICGPVCLGYLVHHFNSVEADEDSEYTKVLLGLGIVGSTLLMLFTHHPFFYGVQCTGMKVRIASCSLIYRKALKLSTKSLGQTTVGQLVNLLSNDVNRFDTSIIFLHYMWIGPLQSIISTIILWQVIGISCLAGMVLILFFVPMQSYMGKIFSRLRLATAFRTDERIRIMNEMISAIRVIKMYAWETPFRKIIEGARKKEIEIIMKANYFRTINLSLFFTSAKIIVFLSLLTFVVTGNILTAEKVFLTSALINNIRLSMTLFFPFAVSLGSESLISCKRIQTFLEMEEREECSRVSTSDLRPKPQHCYVEGYDINARWDETSGEDNLHKISFYVRAGEVMAIIGPVGSGKSSLLYSILRELPIKEGQINVRGRIAFASQEPWLFSGTIKQNILFGQPFKAKRYNEVIKVCALERDMELFPERDQTLVGERGVSLSGGQRARINLARAIYYDADIYLLDDPLSAVDAHVGKHLFEQCILKFLKNKVTIIATHQLQFLKNTSNILYLNNGYVEAQGTYTQLKTTGVDFAGIKAVSEEEATNDAPQEEDNEHLISKVTRLRRASEAWSLKHRGSIDGVEDLGFDNTSMMTASLLGGSIISINEDFPPETFVDGEKKDEGQETKATGSVGIKVYMKYFLAGGGALMFVIFMTMNVICQVLFTGSDYWLSFWTNKEQISGLILMRMNQTDQELDLILEQEINATHFEFTSDDRNHYVSIYAGITAGLLIASLVRTVLLFRISMIASKNLHNRMFATVIKVPMAFFDVHPIGQILNRFSKDTGQVDDLLPPAMYDFLTITFTIIGIIIMILYLNIWFLIPTAILGVLFSVVRWVYVSSSRDIKRLEGITRSPVFSHLSSTFQGLSTIRAFQSQSAVTVQFDDYQDTHTSAWSLFIASSRLFGISLDALSTIFISVVTFTFILNGESLGGNVGLAISLAMMLSGMLQWGVRQSAEVENHMTSVERMIEYSKIEAEVSKDVVLEPKKSDWPNYGRLTFDTVYLYYKNDEPPVLKNLNFTIQPSEKVGIVGRTGAGKSSLLTCLFRLTPPHGDIIIDDVNTSKICLEDLRKSISIIPQDPTLFTGSVRYNLDPFNEYSDDKIWNAIEEVQLKEQVSDMSGHLEAHISEGGSNLSVGQRQLVCLARAILKHNKILVMDEATANVDPKTDTWIQQTIRDKFRDCTVLTIAHRLHTIMDSDRVMVMDSGKLKEFGPPHELLTKSGSIFQELVHQTGPVTSEELKRTAEEAYLRKYGQTVTKFCIPEIRENLTTDDDAVDSVRWKDVEKDKEKEDNGMQKSTVKICIIHEENEDNVAHEKGNESLETEDKNLYCEEGERRIEEKNSEATSTIHEGNEDTGDHEKGNESLETEDKNLYCEEGERRIEEKNSEAISTIHEENEDNGAHEKGNESLETEDKNLFCEEGESRIEEKNSEAMSESKEESNSLSDDVENTRL